MSVHQTGGVSATAQLNGVWSDGTVTTDPADNAELEDTGQLDAGDYFVSVVARSTANALIELVWRNAADTGDQRRLGIPVPAGNLVQFVAPTKITLAQNERLTVRMDGALTGVIEAHIFYARITG